MEEEIHVKQTEKDTDDRGTIILAGYSSYFLCQLKNCFAPMKIIYTCKRKGKDLTQSSD